MVPLGIHILFNLVKEKKVNVEKRFEIYNVLSTDIEVGTELVNLSLCVLLYNFTSTETLVIKVC